MRYFKNIQFSQFLILNIFQGLPYPFASPNSYNKILLMSQTNVLQQPVPHLSSYSHKIIIDRKQVLKFTGSNGTAELRNCFIRLPLRVQYKRIIAFLFGQNEFIPCHTQIHLCEKLSYLLSHAICLLIYMCCCLTKEISQSPPPFLKERILLWCNGFLPEAILRGSIIS